MSSPTGEFGDGVGEQCDAVWKSQIIFIYYFSAPGKWPQDLHGQEIESDHGLSHSASTAAILVVLALVAAPVLDRKDERHNPKSRPRNIERYEIATVVSKDGEEYSG